MQVLQHESLGALLCMRCSVASAGEALSYWQAVPEHPHVVTLNSPPPPSLSLFVMRKRDFEMSHVYAFPECR